MRYTYFKSLVSDIKFIAMSWILELSTSSVSLSVVKTNSKAESKLPLYKKQELSL